VTWFILHTDILPHWIRLQQAKPYPKMVVVRAVHFNRLCTLGFHAANINMIQYFAKHFTSVMWFIGQRRQAVSGPKVIHKIKVSFASGIRAERWAFCRTRLLVFWIFKLMIFSSFPKAEVWIRFPMVSMLSKLSASAMSFDWASIPAKETPAKMAREIFLIRKRVDAG